MYWHKSGDKRTVKRINELLKSIDRTPFTGIGKPEALRYQFEGKWSRRIDAMNRLVYQIDNNQLIIYSCKDHY
jgi:toxin YoeB